MILENSLATAHQKQDITQRALQVSSCHEVLKRLIRRTKPLETARVVLEPLEHGLLCWPFSCFGRGLIVRSKRRVVLVFVFVFVLVLVKTRHVVVGKNHPQTRIEQLKIS